MFIVSVFGYLDRSASTVNFFPVSSKIHHFSKTVLQYYWWIWVRAISSLSSSASIIFFFPLNFNFALVWFKYQWLVFRVAKSCCRFLPEFNERTELDSITRVSLITWHWNPVTLLFPVIISNNVFIFNYYIDTRIAIAGHLSRSLNRTSSSPRSAHPHPSDIRTGQSGYSILFWKV